MERTTSDKEILADGLRLEKSGELKAAAASYRKLSDNDPFNQEAVNRLLVVYRKLKDYREELAVIRRVLAAYEKHDKVRRENWLREHSKAAVAGTAVFQKLGGARVSGFGADPVVTMLTRRRETVERKLSGKKGSRRIKKVAAKPAVGEERLREKRNNEKRKDAANRKKEETAARRRKEAARKEEMAARRREEAARKEEVRAARKEEAAAARKAREDAREKAAAEKKRPSLFVITLRYLVPPEKIDAAMADHMAFLDKHYKKGEFLVSGRQEPRVGGIILSRGKDRRLVERMMQDDPLVKWGLASVEVVEFKVSQTGKELTGYFGSK